MNKEEEEKDGMEGREKEKEKERQAGTLKERKDKTERKERKGTKNRVRAAKTVSRGLAVCLPRSSCCNRNTINWAGLETKVCFSQLDRLGSPKSRCWQIRRPVRAHLRGHGGQSFHCALTRWAQRGGSVRPAHPPKAPPPCNITPGSGVSIRRGKSGRPRSDLSIT